MEICEISISYHSFSACTFSIKLFIDKLVNREFGETFENTIANAKKKGNNPNSGSNHRRRNPDSCGRRLVRDEAITETIAIAESLPVAESVSESISLSKSLTVSESIPITDSCSREEGSEKHMGLPDVHRSSCWKRSFLERRPNQPLRRANSIGCWWRCCSLSGYRLDLLGRWFDMGLHNSPGRQVP